MQTEASRKRRESDCENGKMDGEECVCNDGYSMNDGNCEADGMFLYIFSS